MHNTYYIILVIFLALWLFLIRPAIFGQLGGTLIRREVPVEYVKLKDFLHKQPGFFRTLWIPRQHRFTYYSSIHIPVEAEPFFKKAKITDIINQLGKLETEKYLSEVGIKYIIVPHDPSGEIFVKDRKYDATQYKNTIVALEKIPWLSRISGFEKIAVFEIKSLTKDLFWLEKNGSITYTTSDLRHYTLNITIDSPQKLIFSENFHSTWQLQFPDRVIPAQKTMQGLNSFSLSKGTYQGNLVFTADKYYVYGKIISVGTFILIVIFLLQYAWKKYTIHK